jgi:hypothetical protein
MVAYTGNGSARTVSHGLGVVPEMIIVKTRNSVDYWPVYHTGPGNSSALHLQSTRSAGSDRYWDYTNPTSSVFYVSNDNGVGGPYNYISYLFASKPNISKVGSYTGNG